MAHLTQITVNPGELEKSERELAALSKKIANRRVKIQFINTKGAVADSIIGTANQLNEIGIALAKLIQKTENAVKDTRILFTNADNSLAQWWGSEE